MNSSKTFNNNSSATKMPRFKSCMFSTTALTIIFISNSNPPHSFRLAKRKDIFLIKRMRMA
ncbi:hypothetical protein X975_21427, partial [Stegodyphus mimosarum]